MTLQNNISTNSHISIKGDVIHAAPFLEDYISTNSYLEKRSIYKNEKPSLHNNLHTVTYLNNFYNKHKNEYIQETLNSYASINTKTYDYNAETNNNVYTNSYCAAYIPYVLSYEYSAFYKLPGQPARQYHIILNNKLITYYTRVHLIGLKNILQTSSSAQAYLIKDAFVFNNNNQLNIQSSVYYYYLHNNIKYLTNEINTQVSIKTTTMSPYRQVEVENILNTTSNIMMWYKQDEIETLDNKINTAYNISHYYINIIKLVLDNIQTQAYTQTPKSKHEPLVDNINKIITTTSTSLSQGIIIQNVSNNIQTQSNIKIQKTLEAFTNIYLYTQGISNSFTLHNDLEYTHNLITQSNLNKYYKHKEIGHTDIINTTQNINIIKQSNIIGSDSVVAYAKTTIPETVDTYVEGLVNKLNTDKSINIYYKYKTLEDLTNIISTDSSVKYSNHLLLNIDNYITSVSYYNISITGVFEASLNNLNINSNAQIYYKYENNFALNNVLNTTSNLTHTKELIYEPFNIVNTTSDCLVAEFIYETITDIINIVDSTSNCQTYYKNKNDLTLNNLLNTTYNQTYTLAVYDFEVNGYNQINTTSTLNQVFNAKYTIMLNKQSGTGGTNSINYINTYYIDPVSITIPTRNYYNSCGYYEESFSDERIDWLAFVPTNSSTNKRITFETPYANGDEAVFLNNLYNNSSLWRIHAVIHSTHAITAFDVSDKDVTAQVITLSTSPNYTYLFDVAITEGMANYNASGAHYEFIDCVTNKDAIITFKDTWVYKKNNNLVQRISSEGVYINLTEDTYNSNKTLYAQWAPYSIKVNWKNYAGGIVKTQNVYYEGYSDITPTISYAPAGTTNTTQYTYNWPVVSYSINSEHTHRQVINVQETRNTNQYTITWKSYAGATLKTETINYGATSTAPTSTTNTTQYTYSWPKASTTVVGNETIQETRTINKYTITWKSYAGTVLKQETINYGNTSTAPTGTTNNAQYTYSWPKATTTVSGDETIQEIRVVNKYDVEFKNYVGSIVSTQNLAYGTTPTPPANTSNTVQYTYSWPSVNNVTGAVTYTEIRTVNKYTLTWKSYAGTTILTNSYDYGTVVNAPIGTSNTAGYTYAWPKASVTVTKNETVQETRTANKFTVTFNANGGTTPVPTTKQVTYNEAYGTLANTSKTNYVFLGWHKAMEDGNLVRNGYHQSGDLTNFNFTGYDAIENAFYQTSGSVTRQMTDYIEVQGNGLDQFDQYEIKADHKQPTVNVGYSKYYFMIICYDKFYQQIAINQVYARANTATTLTSALNSGDEWVYVDDITNWYDDGQVNNVHQKTLALWHPDDPEDPYTPYKYTRRIFAVKYIDKPNKRLQLNAKYNGITIPSGAPVQNHQSGSTHSYIGVSNATMTSSWVTRTGISSAAANVNSMRYGSKYFKVAWMLNRNAGTETTYIRNISARNITNPKQQNLITSTTIVDTTKNHTVYAHWNPANVYSVIEGLVTNGQTDIKFGENIFISRTEIVSTNVYMEYENQTIFTITLNKQNGTGGTNTIEGLTGVSITPASITTPTRTNYTFLGYYNQSSGGVKYINSNGTYNNLDSTTFIGDVTLYAQWSIVNRTAQWKADPATIGILADVYINDVIKGTGVTTYSAAQAANAMIKVKNHTVPPGWTYSTYTLSNLTSAVVGGSGNNIEIQATGDMTKTGTRVLTTKFTAATYSITVNQNSGTGSSASISQYTPSATNTTTITMTKGTREGYRIIGWTLSGVNNLAELSGHTITIPVYTNTIQPYGNLTITPIWALAMAEGLNEIVTDATTTYEAVHPITITLDKQSGTGGTSSIQSVKGFYTDPTSITAPTRTGHTFGGYYTSTGGTGTQRINNVGVFINLTHNTYTSNVTLYAYWIVNQYTITFNSAGGTVVNSITQNYGVTITAPNDPTKTGYTFTGWQPVLPSTMPAANSTLTAQWSANTYTVTFNGNGGTSPTSKSVTYDNTYGSLTNSTRSGYQFIGWFTAITGGTKITANTVMNTASNHTLYAHWNPTQVKDIVNNIETVGVCATDYVPAVYIITPSKDSNVDTFSVTPSTYSPKNTSQTISINRTYKNGYMANVLTLTRVQPYGGATPTISGNTITIPANSYGAFNLHQTSVGVPITVTFNADGGTTPNPTTKTVTYNTAIGTLPNTTRVGYTFDGWYTPTNVKVTTNTIITTIGGITLKAKWTPNTYYVEYDPVEDVLIVGDTYKYITYGSNYGQPPAFGSLLGYTLAGWKTADGFAVTPSTIMNRAYDHTLYAVWEPNEFDITLNPNTGNAGSKTKIAVVYNTSIEPFSNNMKPTKTGYTFKGFYTSTSGGTQRIGPSSYISLTSSTYSSATTLYAQWQGSTHSIYFNANGGSTPSPSSKHVTYGQPVGALPNTTKSGFVFDGWFDGDIEITANTIWLTNSSRTLTAKWVVPKTTKPTLATHMECRQLGMFEMCTMYLDVQNNMSFTGTIKYGSSNPPSSNGGTIIGNGSKQISIGSLINGKWNGADFYYATITVDGYEESDVAVVYVST